MPPIPSPYFPEPITVPGNVAAGDFPTARRFLRTVGIGHLLSLVGLVGLTAAWQQTGYAEILFGHNLEVAWLAAIGALAILAWLRGGPLSLQTAAFLCFALAFTAGMAMVGPFIANDFFDFAYAFRFAFTACWVGLMLYNILAGRDYSLVGEYVLTHLFCGAVMVYFTFTTYLSASQGFSVWVLVGGMLFYWVYDLAMVSRRRRPDQRLAAIFDLYRDVLNFVGYPLRVMNMPRGRRRLQQKW